jgi:hypothetical protein
VVELVVFRGVACKAPFSALLLKWLADVIHQACHDRRDVRVSYVLSLNYSSALIKMLCNSPLILAKLSS